MAPTIHSSTRSDTSLGKPDCCMQSQHHVFQLSPSLEAQKNLQSFAIIMHSVQAKSLVTDNMHLEFDTHMPPVVIDLSNHSRNPSFTNMDTGIIHWHNGTRWLWHNGTGTASGIKDKGWNLTACYYSRQSWYATVGTKRHTGRSPSPVSLMFTSSLKCLNCTPDRYSIYHVISPYSCTNNVTV